MIAADDKLLTIGNPRRDLRFTSFTQRQIDYENGQALDRVLGDGEANQSARGAQ